MGISIYEPAEPLVDETRRHAAVDASGALNATGDDALRDIVRTTRRLLGASMAAVSIVHEDWQYLIAADGLSEGAYSRRTSFCGHVVRAPEQILDVPDAARDTRFAGNPVVTEDGGIRSYAGAALLDDEGVPLGTLCVFDWRPRAPLSQAAAAELRANAAEVVMRLRALRDSAH